MSQSSERPLRLGAGAPIHLPRCAVEDLRRKVHHREAGELSAKPTEGAFCLELIQ